MHTVDEFDEDYHREYYADLPLDKLEKAIESNKKIADAALPAGRSASDDHEPPPEKRRQVRAIGCDAGAVER